MLRDRDKFLFDMRCEQITANKYSQQCPRCKKATTRRKGDEKEGKASISPGEVSFIVSKTVNESTMKKGEREREV